MDMHVNITMLKVQPPLGFCAWKVDWQLLGGFGEK